MSKLIIIGIALAGAAGGVGAGFLLRPDPEAVEVHANGDMVCPPPADGSEAMAPPPPDGPVEFVRFSNQFVVPVMQDDDLDSMVILTLSLEVELGSQAEIFNMEPKVRDAFLRVLFDHANTGGFSGNYLSSVGLDTLRVALRETARKTIGPQLYDVLIVDLVKQNI